MSDRKRAECKTCTYLCDVLGQLILTLSGSNWPQMGQIRGFFQIRFSTFARQMYWIWSEKNPRICPIWGQFDPLLIQIWSPRPCHLILIGGMAMKLALFTEATCFTFIGVSNNLPLGHWLSASGTRCCVSGSGGEVTYSGVLGYQADHWHFMFSHYLMYTVEPRWLGISHDNL